jgi:hypothetical protein
MSKVLAEGDETIEFKISSIFSSFNMFNAKSSSFSPAGMAEIGNIVRLSKPEQLKMVSDFRFGKEGNFVKL